MSSDREKSDIDYDSIMNKRTDDEGSREGSDVGADEGSNENNQTNQEKTRDSGNRPPFEPLDPLTLQPTGQTTPNLETGNRPPLELPDPVTSQLSGLSTPNPETGMQVLFDDLVDTHNVNDLLGVNSGSNTAVLENILK